MVKKRWFVLFFSSVLLLSGCSHEHSYGEWTEVKAATCTETGTKERACSCGEKETETIEALGHTVVDMDDVEATCLEDGSKGGKKCSVCGTIIEEPEVIKGEHSYDKGVKTKEPTCTEKGEYTYTCSVCGDEKTSVIKALGHDYDDGVVTQEATCTQEGVRTYTCKVCGDEKTNTIKKSSHDFDDGKITKEASCTEEGEKTYTCSVCGYTKTEEISKLSHDPDDNYICKVCGQEVPIELDMTSAEISAAKKVKYMGNCGVQYNEADENFEILFCLKDEDKTPIACPCIMDVRIEDENGVIVYSKKRKVPTSDFSTWSDSFSGNLLMGCVKIGKDEIVGATSQNGTLYMSVYNDYMSFEEIAESIYNNLPLAAPNVEIPALPASYSRIGFSGTIYSSCKVLSVSFESLNSTAMVMHTSIEKTYDSDGAGHSGSVMIGYKLYDSEGYVVTSGTIFSSALKVGDKEKDVETNIYDIVPGESYRIEFIDSE